MDTLDLLHLLRNPYGHSDMTIRMARIEAADLIEQQAAELAKVTAERDESIQQLTQRLKQSHELRRALDALELYTIPELRAEIERLREESRLAAITRVSEQQEAREVIEQLRAENSKAIAEVGNIGRQLGKAQAEADRLRADAERYRILRKRSGYSVYCVIFTPYGVGHIFGDELDEAIDAARGE